MQYLLFLACPISMGAMMWIMMRGGHQSTASQTEDPRLAQLQLEVDELRRRSESPAAEPEPERATLS